jgi:hypothetical protein
MGVEEIIRKRIKKLKEVHPELDEEQLERELIPLSGEKVGIRTLKKRKRL